MKKSLLNLKRKNYRRLELCKREEIVSRNIMVINNAHTLISYTEISRYNNTKIIGLIITSTAPTNDSTLKDGTNNHMGGAHQQNN